MWHCHASWMLTADRPVACPPEILHKPVDWLPCQTLVCCFEAHNLNCHFPSRPMCAVLNCIFAAASLPPLLSETFAVLLTAQARLLATCLEEAAKAQNTTTGKIEARQNTLKWHTILVQVMESANGARSNRPEVNWLSKFGVCNLPQ